MKDSSHDRPLRNRALSVTSGGQAAEDQENSVPKAVQKSACFSAGEEKTIRIEGMMCHHCEMAVQNALEALDFISAAVADYEKGTVRVRFCGDPDEEAIRKAVTEEDYEYLGMEP